MFHSVDQQDAATKSAMTFQRLLHRYCNSSVVDLIHIDLYSRSITLINITPKVSCVSAYVATVVMVTKTFIH